VGKIICKKTNPRKNLVRLQKDSIETKFTPGIRVQIHSCQHYLVDVPYLPLEVDLLTLTLLES